MLRPLTFLKSLKVAMDMGMSTSHALKSLRREDLEIRIQIRLDGPPSIKIEPAFVEGDDNSFRFTPDREHLLNLLDEISVKDSLYASLEIQGDMVCHE